MLKRRSHLLNGMKIRFDARNGESGRRKVEMVQVRKVEIILTRVAVRVYLYETKPRYCVWGLARRNKSVRKIQTKALVSSMKTKRAKT